MAYQTKITKARFGVSKKKKRDLITFQVGASSVLAAVNRVNASLLQAFDGGPAK